MSLAASQTTSGTFADARIAASNVTQHQAALTILESQITDSTLLSRNASNETITGSWQFNNPIVTATPSSGSHATTKDYVDQAIAGLSWKNSVNVATTANITLSGTQTIDGVAVVAGNRVLVKNQSTQAENGVYVVAAGAWTRATDFDQTSPIDEVNSAAVFVRGGTAQADTAWTQTAPVVSIGSDAIVFSQFAGANTYIGGSGMTLSGNAFSVGTASSSRIVINTDDIDLALVSNSGTGTFQKLATDSYGRVTGTTAVVAGDITTLVNATYVAKAGDTMTGALNAPRLNLLNTGATDSILSFGIGGAGATGFIGMSGAAGTIINTSAVGDLLYRTVSKAHRFSVDAGATAAMTIASSGAITTSGTFTAGGIISSNDNITAGAGSNTLGAAQQMLGAGTFTVANLVGGQGFGGRMVLITGADISGVSFAATYIVAVIVAGGGGAVVAATLLARAGSTTPTIAFGNSGNTIQVTLGSGANLAYTRVVG